MTDRPVLDAASRLREAATSWGVDPKSPEGVWVESMATIAVAQEEQLLTIPKLIEDRIQATNPLTPEALEQAMQRPALKAMTSAWRSVKGSSDRQWIVGMCVAVAMAIVLSAAGGYSLAYTVGWNAAAAMAADMRPALQGGSKGAQWLANVVRNNDVGQLADACKASTYQTTGGEACHPAMWIGTRRSP